MSSKSSLTMFDKIWQEHLIADGLIYIDLHLLHEVTSPQAFAALRNANRLVRRPDKTLATVDHNVPTDGTKVSKMIADHLSRKQVETLEANCQEFNIPIYSLGSEHQGIVHVISPELGTTQPGMTIVCGDSHTSTHGAFGTLAFGIGTSEVEHVLATQCLVQRKPASMRINYVGQRGYGVESKDLILATIGQLGTNGMSGYIVEYSGAAIKQLSMSERMTVCNMTIEGGGRAGMIAPDDTTYAWLKNRQAAPQNWNDALQRWQKLPSDPDAVFDKEIIVDVEQIAPMVTWGTTPAMVKQVTEFVPEAGNASEQRALEYMDLQPGTSLTDIPLQRVFIGSCTNSRIEDLRQAADLVKRQNKKVSNHLRAMVVPGSQQVKMQAEKEGLDQVFIKAGFEWRHAGCSMCLGMNPDVLASGERCASTSNRNFEGRQGKGGRTHLVSPKMAAAAALYGHFVDIRDL